jgi:hypothetical protein
VAFEDQRLIVRRNRAHQHLPLRLASAGNTPGIIVTIPAPVGGAI